MSTVISPAKPSAPGVTRPGPRRERAAGSGVARYRDALRTPGALAFAIPGVIGRMPMAMLSLAMVMLLTAVTGSYGVAGAVPAAGAVLYAAVTPRVARLADRYGQARVLRPQVAASPPPPPRWRPAPLAGHRCGRWW